LKWNEKYCSSCNRTITLEYICNLNGKGFETQRAIKEFTLSGLCQKCQNGVFKQ